MPRSRMSETQPASVCLGVLRRQPQLAQRLPPQGYVELMHAVKREAERDIAPTLPYVYAS